MISIVLLLKIIGVMCAAAGWVFLCLYTRRTALRLERLAEYCEERLDALEELVGPVQGTGAAETECDEELHKALEAERRFTEGIASILNFSHTNQNGSPADTITVGDASRRP